MYFQVVTQCTQNLKNLESWLDKAEQFATEKKFDALTAEMGERAHDTAEEIKGAAAVMAQIRERLAALEAKVK